VGRGDPARPLDATLFSPKTPTGRAEPGGGRGTRCDRLPTRQHESEQRRAARSELARQIVKDGPRDAVVQNEHQSGDLRRQGNGIVELQHGRGFDQDEIEVGEPPEQLVEPFARKEVGDRGGACGGGGGAGGKQQQLSRVHRLARTRLPAGRKDPAEGFPEPHVACDHVADPWRLGLVEQVVKRRPFQVEIDERHP